MSEPISKFLAKVAEDEAFRQRLLATETPEATQAVLREAGCEVTEADLRAFSEQHAASGGEALLNDEALAGVAGGGVKDAARILLNITNDFFRESGDNAFPFISTKSVTDSAAQGISSVVKTIANLF